MEFEDTMYVSVRTYEGIKVLFKIDLEYDDYEGAEDYIFSVISQINGNELKKTFKISDEIGVYEAWLDLQDKFDSIGLDHVQSFKRMAKDISEFNT